MSQMDDGFAYLAALFVGVGGTTQFLAFVERPWLACRKRLNVAEFVQTVPHGWRFVIALVLLNLAFLPLAMLSVMVALQRVGVGPLGILVFPPVFILTMEVPIAVFETWFGVSPRLSRAGITFIVGDQVRTCGRARALVAFGLLAAVAVAIALGF
jgi:hypothetical protein